MKDGGEVMGMLGMLGYGYDKIYEISAFMILGNRLDGLWSVMCGICEMLDMGYVI